MFRYIDIIDFLDKMTNKNHQDIAGAQPRVSEFDNNECSICLGQHIDKSNPPCGHVFCFQCLCDWCEIKLECPICKKPFTSFIKRVRHYYAGLIDSDEEFHDSDNSLVKDKIGERYDNFLSDMYNNRRNDLITFLRSRNSTEPVDEALYREISPVFEEYGRILRNNPRIIRKLQKWRDETPNRPAVITAFFSQHSLEGIENDEPGMTEVLNDIYSLLLQI